ncbi:MAG: urocanate hydratase [Desulfovibrio sp.]|jgi:urocanate hydratase|nr:urocanate hydratase [Desulfovibrio sp.]
MLTDAGLMKSMNIMDCGELPVMPAFEDGIRRAPDRGYTLDRTQTRLALRNALRYVPEEHHEVVAPEFLEELRGRGRIYGYRFRPWGRIYGKSIDSYRGRCLEGKAFQVMLDNNLDFDVALYPYELVTYGETGQVCQNWMQYRLIKRYLEELTREQTLVVESGHPLGLFRSRPDAPRVIITNGLMVGAWDNAEDWRRAAQLGVSNYGQMTAGGWMYIGPQGIVHGTYNTLLNAGRIFWDLPDNADLAGKLFVSSGLGGMSGAQPKAAEIAGAVSVIAEVDQSRIKTRLEQGWICRASAMLPEIFREVNGALKERKPLSIGYHGNVVDLLQYCVDEDVKIHLLSDQTSCHVAHDGGYCPQGLTFDERTRMLRDDREVFRRAVNETLRKHYSLIKILVNRGAYFFDYGNAFLKAVFDAGVQEVSKNGKDDTDGFIFPSYVEDIMGPYFFDYGYGPFRWVCLSGKPADLAATDRAAMNCMYAGRRPQDRDNMVWLRDAEKNSLVVGTQARILYQDAEGRLTIALKFNEMVRKDEIGPVMLGRDHHDVAGTDSPFRETANVKDGSNITADMAVQCFAGNAARGMSLIALHNGGGVGIGKAINGGFGMVLDGSARVDEILKTAMRWDVMGGVARRGWAGNPNAMEVCAEYNRAGMGKDYITLPYRAKDDLLDRFLS